MSNIYVLGKTNKREVTIVSTERRFVQNEYFVIEDKILGDITGEVIETTSYPFAIKDYLPEGCAIEYLEYLNIRTDIPLYVANLKLLEVIQEPVTPLSSVREPYFTEIKKYLLPTQPQEGLLFGVINGTNRLQKDLPIEYQNIAPLWEKGKAIKQEGIPFAINHKSFREYPGVGFFGGSGSGKTYALRVMCEELMKKSIPAIALDPHNELNFKDYMTGIEDEQKIDYSSKYEIFEIGENIGIKFTDLSKNELKSLIEFTDQLSQPMATALDVLYEKGDTYNNLINKIKKLKKVVEIMERPLRERNQDEIDDKEQMLYLKYKDKIAGSTTLQGLLWRLEGLYATGIFTSNIDKLESALKQRKLAIIRSSNMKLLMLSSYVFKKLYYKRRNFKDLQNGEPFPPFMIVIDEAHIFAPTDKNSPTKKILKEIAQEARKYGVFEVLCTQRPALLDKTIVSQLNTKCIFRTKDVDDIDVLSKEANLDEDAIKSLPDLPSGHCYISSATLNKNFSIRFRTTLTQAPHQDNPFDELDDIFKSENEELEKLIIEQLPFNSYSLNDVQTQVNKKSGCKISTNEVLSIIKTLVNKNIIEEKPCAMGVQYKLKK